MDKSLKKIKIPIAIEFTDGYQERFTNAILKIYLKRVRQEEQTADGKDNKSV